jgi:hypothetical protein
VHPEDVGIAPTINPENLPMFGNRLIATTLLAGIAALAGPAWAAPGPDEDLTRIAVRTVAGDIERVDVTGPVAVGETRALTTARGNPATLVASADGWLLELAGERFEIDMPDTDPEALAALGSDPAAGRVVRRIEVDTDTQATDGERKVREVRVVRTGEHGEGAGDAPEVLVMPLADPELALAQAEGKRVMVVRTIKRHASGTP